MFMVWRCFGALHLGRFLPKLGGAARRRLFFMFWSGLFYVPGRSAPLKGQARAQYEQINLINEISGICACNMF
jgi:hypothetical protein